MGGIKRGVLVNKVDMQTCSVVGPCSLGTSHHFGFSLVIEALETWSLFFCPLTKIRWHASNPYPHSFFTHFPHPFPFCLSLPLLFTSKLLSFVLFDPTDLYCYCIFPTVFTWGTLIIFFGTALDCVCSSNKKWPCA